MENTARQLLAWGLLAMLALGCGPVQSSDEVRELAAAGLEQSVDVATQQAVEDEAAAPSGETPSFYKFTDDAGSVRFVTSLDQVPAHLQSQARPAGRGRLSRLQTSAPRRPTAATAPAARSARNADVVVYTAPWCGWCRKTVAWLDARNVPYENKDIESDDRYRRELRQKSGRTSIPFVEIGDQTISGFSPQRMQRMLEGHRI